MSTDDEWVSGSDFDAAQERIAQLEADNKKLELLVLAAMTPQSNYLEERIRTLEAALKSVREARLEWAMTCPCECAHCDVFYNRIREREFTALSPETPEVKK